MQNNAPQAGDVAGRKRLRVPVVRVGADQHRAVLGVERKVTDVDVARRLEDSSRLPVQAPVGVQQNADTVKVRHQLFRSATRTYSTLSYKRINKSKVIWQEAESLSPVYATLRFRGNSNLQLHVLVGRSSPNIPFRWRLCICQMTSKSVEWFKLAVRL